MQQQQQQQQQESMIEDQNKPCTQQKDQPIYLKLPHPPTNNQILTKQQLIALSQYPQSLTLSKDPLVCLTVRKQPRPLYLTTISRYLNKETNEQIQISKVSEYTRMADFYISQANKLSLNSSNKMEEIGSRKFEGKDNQQDMCDMKGSLFAYKDYLKRKILGQDVSLQSYNFVAQPAQFLKSFNLSLCNADLLVNKIKKNKNQFRSRHIAFGQPIPDGPQIIPQYVKNLKIFPKIQQYINKRPCWLRNVLEYQLRLDGFRGQYTTSQLKSILKYLCYTFRDGPWKHVFCRFGYNPTIIKEATIYQILMVKIKRKEVQDYQEKDAEILQEQNDIYDPSLRQIPTKYLRIYQLCDIEDKRIQGLIKEAAVISEQCNKQRGWLGKNEYIELLRITKSIRDERTKSIS